MLKRQLLWLLLMPFYLWGVTITENTTLSEDVVYNEDVIIQGAILNLNYHTMTVNGDLNITGAYARLQMTKSTDKLIVKGNLFFSGASTYQDLTDGVIELAGNFYQKGTEREYYYSSTKNGTDHSQRYRANNAFSFYPTDNHKVILNGTSKQIIDFESPNNSRFNNLEIQNSSSEGILFEQLNIVGEWKRNNNQVSITDIRNLTLTEDYTISNDVEVIGGILNLNGFTLSINGNLKILNSYGRLQMKKADDKLIITGDLTFSGASSYQDLTNGVIELAGNFYQKGTETEYYYSSTKNGTDHSQRYRANNAFSFYPTENHKLILNGNSLQRVSFEAPDSSRFMNLEITNDSIVFDLEAGKKVSVIDGLYLDENLYDSTYKDNEFITYNRYRDIHSTYMSIKAGLSLISLPTALTISESQITSIFSDKNISHILKYDSYSNQWQGFGNNDIARKKIANHNLGKIISLKAGEGFFLKTESKVELKFPKNDAYDFYSTVDSLSSGWNLVGTNKLIDLNELLRKRVDIKIIRRYKEGKYRYLSNDTDIVDEFRHMDISKIEDTNVTNSGFWVYIE